MKKDWGVARFYGLGSIEYLLDNGQWLPDSRLVDGAPILLFESMVEADKHAKTVAQGREPHGVRFMIDVQGKVVMMRTSQTKKSRPRSGR